MGAASWPPATCPSTGPSRRSSAAGRVPAPRSPPTRCPGVRAALCTDATTAAGARRWNDANALALSLRTTSEALLAEILDAWFAAEPSAAADDRENIGHLAEIGAHGAGNDRAPAVGTTRARGRGLLPAGVRCSRALPGRRDGTERGCGQPAGGRRRHLLGRRRGARARQSQPRVARRGNRADAAGRGRPGRDARDGRRRGCSRGLTRLQGTRLAARPCRGIPTATIGRSGVRLGVWPPAGHGA